jgi:Ni,Fe-hydrogenase III small subunit/formate hydrogenlyase subunit 6/NADH:ubiquinone oxidoreductase subunit I
MLRTLMQSLRDGVVTTRYPDAPAETPERFRGAPEPEVGRPFAALPPASVCPTGAIAAGEGAAYTIDLGRCIFCGRCAEEPPDGAIRIGREFELSARRREDLLVRIGRDADGRVTELAPEPADTAALDERVAERIHRSLGRSLHLRHLDAGSCNACDWELVALLAPRYDVRRLGIDFVASPRHADGVIVTGPVTRNLELAVRRTFEAIPEPRVVIAVGACGCSGGIAPASYASAGGVDQILPVDVYVPGCPPRPEAILFGILMAVGRIEAKRGPAPARQGRRSL